MFIYECVRCIYVCMYVCMRVVCVCMSVYEYMNVCSVCINFMYDRSRLSNPEMVCTLATQRGASRVCLTSGRSGIAQALIPHWLNADRTRDGRTNLDWSLRAHTYIYAYIHT